MNFAPYQDEHPELERALSPPPGKNRSSVERVRSPPPQNTQYPPSSTYPNVQPLPSPNAFGNDPYGHTTPRFESREERGQSLEAFQTSIPMRLDYEAMLAYLLLPPAGGVFLLIFEHKSDYVRFHAWQSSMLFSAIFVLHLLLVWSTILSWMLFTVDVGLIGFLTWHAYRDVENLDHFEVPIFGRLANSFVDNE